jgi:hypothetical protein
MDPLFGAGRWDLDELTINYRNPQEVSAIASAFAHRQGSVHLHGERGAGACRTQSHAISVADPSLAQRDRDAHQTLDLVSDFVGDDGTGRVAIIAPSDRIAVLRAASLRVFAPAAWISTATPSSPLSIPGTSRSRSATPKW